MNPGFFRIFGNLEREFLRNESGIFGIFGNLEWEFKKKMNPGFLEFSETWNRNFFKK